MKSSSLILLLGVMSLDWTVARKLTHGNYVLNIDSGTLKSVTAVGNSKVIDLSGLKIKKIDGKVFDKLTGALTLDLSHNELEEFPSSIFSKLTNLETLSLADNRIRRLDTNFVGLNNLKLLNLSENSLRDLQEGNFYGVTKSVDIVVEGNPLRTLPTNVFSKPLLPDDKIDVSSPIRPDFPPNLEEEAGVPALPEGIDIKLCKTADGLVESVDILDENEELGKCSKAVIIRERRVLDFSGLGITKFQPGWYKLGGFFFNGINLSNNSITEITADLLNDLPPGLDHVDLSINKIRIIRKNVISNPRMDTIILANNIISTIEDEAFKNTEITSLSLQYNRLKSLKFAATLPSTLERLIVFGNEISQVPDSLGNLKKLYDLDISKNKLNHLSANVFRGLNELYRIDLSENQLTRIEPGTFNDQEKLFGLRLNDNLISELKPGSLRGLNGIQFIHLQHNKLKKITKGSFPESKNKDGYFLSLTHNEINTIQEGSFNNVLVSDLDLSYNKLSEGSIAKGAFNTSTLHMLFLDNNQFKTINGESFYGLSELHHLSFVANQIKSIKKGAAQYLGSYLDFDLSKNPIERLENGALYGLLKAAGTRVNLNDTPIKVIQSGIFDDV